MHLLFFTLLNIVFAYGATGAGKTFSMLGSPQTPGVIFLSMMDLYNIKESEKDERKIDVSVSYLEVKYPIPNRAKILDN